MTAGGHAVAIQVEVLQGASPAVAEDIGQQARLLLHRSGSISACFVQTTRSGALTPNGVSFSQHSKPKDEDEEGRTSAVHCCPQAASDQVSDRIPSPLYPRNTRQLVVTDLMCFRVALQQWSTSSSTFVPVLWRTMTRVRSGAAFPP